jgi:hypothetical protein
MPCNINVRWARVGRPKTTPPQKTRDVCKKTAGAVERYWARFDNFSKVVKSIRSLIIILAGLSQFCALR